MHHARLGATTTTLPQPRAAAAAAAARRPCCATRLAAPLAAPPAPQPLLRRAAALRPLPARRRAPAPPRARGAPGTADGPDASLPEDGGIAGFDPMEEVGVPSDQRPANELKALREDWLYSWALLPPSGLLARLGLLFAGVFALLGAPISNGTFDPARQPAEFALAAGAGTLVVVAVALVRIYLAWSYVGNRLLSAVVEYEETGWYDGQLFVKPPKARHSGVAVIMEPWRCIADASLRRCWRATGCWARTRSSPRWGGSRGCCWARACRWLQPLPHYLCSSVRRAGAAMGPGVLACGADADRVRCALAPRS
jgi:hypothetical protein